MRKVTAGHLIRYFIRRPLNELSDMGIQDREDIKDILIENLKVGMDIKSYSELIERYYGRIMEYGEQEFELNVFFSLALIGYNKTKCNKVFNLAVRDYMEAAGAQELYDEWFANDVVVWERDNDGTTPTVGNILRECIDIFADRDIHYGDGEMVMILGYCDNCLAHKTREKIRHAFRRDAIEDDPYIWTSLAATWVWILMIEIPHMMVDYEPVE